MGSFLQKKLALDGEYQTRAVLFPAILNLLPFAILLVAVVPPEIRADISCAAKTLKGTSCLAIVSAANVWLCAALCRNLGKRLEDSVFEFGEEFPTTELLLWSDDYLSSREKRLLHGKIKSDCGIRLLSGKAEAKEQRRARKTIRDAVDKIRPKVGDGSRVLLYNTYYGFWRNFTASAWIGALGFALVAYLSRSSITAVASLSIASATYVCLFCFKRPLVRKHARRYAKVFLSEYSGLQLFKSSC